MEIKSMIFTDGTTFFENLSKKYIKHKKGLFIMAPSGVGKTHFCKQQKESHWIDGDELWLGANALPDGPWWKESKELNDKLDKRCDVITMEAMFEGFWIMGASNYWLKPSAIVIPDWETHKSFIKHREENNYDGGATSDDHSQVQGHIAFIEKWIDHDVPLFKSIEAAVEELTRDL